MCLLLFCISFLCCIKYWRNDRKDICEETNRLCNELRKELRNPESTCDRRCETVGRLIDFFQKINGTQSDFSQQIEEKEPEIVGTQSSPSSSTSGAPDNSSRGPPHPFIFSDPQLLPAGPSYAVYDNNKQVSVMMPCSSKIKGKGGKPSKKRRKNDEVKPYKKCTREEAIQIAKGLLSG